MIKWNGKNALDKNGQKIGIWRNNFSNGEPSSTYTYLNGLFHGYFESYDHDGVILLKGCFIKNERTDIWKCYSRNKEIIEITFYL